MIKLLTILTIGCALLLAACSTASPDTPRVPPPDIHRQTQGECSS